jgi:hypothetical protein
MCMEQSINLKDHIVIQFFNFLKAKLGKLFIHVDWSLKSIELRFWLDTKNSSLQLAICSRKHDPSVKNVRAYTKTFYFISFWVDA